MNQPLQARILDTHTVLLGYGDQWIRLSLPWLARDLAELLHQALGTASPNAKELDKERIAALRLVLAQLETDAEPAQTSVAATPCPLKHYREAALIEDDAVIPADGPIVLVLRPAEMLALEEKLAQRSKDALTSILVYSEIGAMVGPVLETRRYCALCLRYLSSPVFGLIATDKTAETYRLQAGLALARCVSRLANDVLVLEHDALKIETYLPFIGCPQCLPQP